MTQLQSVTFDEKKITLLDQTKLPTEEVYLTIDNAQDLWDAIVKLQVRGAPAIGIAAAFGVAMDAQKIEAKNYSEFLTAYSELSEYLASSRPTAVNLFWALDRMKRVVEKCEGEEISQIKKSLIKESFAIQEDDAEICKAIGENALTLLEDGMTLLTHCNAGGIATAKYGTALAPMHLGKERGINFKVFADETRPLLQGARLTTWELMKSGVDVTLITDSMSAMVMKQGLVDAVIVGCDRVAVNGDVANKVGTYGLSVLCEKHNIPFYVACPLSTIDLETKHGDDIVIEERDSSEITEGFGKRTAPEGVKTYNPAFDVSPHELVTAIITEKGIIKGNYSEELPKLFK